MDGNEDTFYEKNNLSWIHFAFIIIIIGIVISIAIPNFNIYRNRSFCHATEEDAHAITNAMNEYFADPNNFTVSKAALMGQNSSKTIYVDAELSSNNPWSVEPDYRYFDTYIVMVTDNSGRCPNNVQTAMDKCCDSRGYWDGDNHYIKFVYR